jgi:hypothetical protein
VGERFSTAVLKSVLYVDTYTKQLVSHDFKKQQAYVYQQSDVEEVYARAKEAKEATQIIRQFKSDIATWFSIIEIFYHVYVHYYYDWMQVALLLIWAEY